MHPSNLAQHFHGDHPLSPAYKLGRTSGTPGSIFDQHSTSKWVSFRSASTPVGPGILFFAVAGAKEWASDTLFLPCGVSEKLYHGSPRLRRGNGSLPGAWRHGH